MNLELNEEQQLVQDALAKAFRENSTGARVRAAEPLGFDRELWNLVSELGVPMMRVAEDHGGGANSLLHAVVAAEEAGRYLASVPVAEAIAVNALLSRLGGAAQAMLDSLGGGSTIATLALHDLKTQPLQIVPAAAVADTIVALDGNDVVALSGHDRTFQKNEGSLPLLRTDLRKAPQRQVLASGAQAKADFLCAVDEFTLLSAAMMASAARQALDNAAQYACERQAFGKLIGTYQGVSHPLAECTAEVEGAKLLVWRVVHEIAKGTADAGALIPLAFWWSGQASRTAVYKAMRVFGGFGMTLEYDAQLYYRRVHGWSLQVGNPDAALQKAADRLWGGAEKPPVPAAGDIGITFDFPEHVQAIAAKCRAFCEARHDMAMEQFQYESLDGHLPDLWREMAAAGWAYPDLPKEYGGGGYEPLVASAVVDTIGDFGWYITVLGVSDIVCRMVIAYGSPECKAEMLPKVLSGNAYCSLGYTEPSGGSDIFAAKTAAVRADDGSGDWIINGQKIFTSQGHMANYCLLIARTSPDKYAGLTLFIVPTHLPGYHCDAVQTIGDDRTNITFYDNMRLPDIYRVGEVNGGVKAMALALTLEHQGGDFYGTEMKHVVKHGVLWANETQPDGTTPMQDPAVRRVLAEAKARLLVVESLGRRATWAATNGKGHKSFGPMAKLFGSESWVHSTAQIMRLAAPQSLMTEFSALGEIEKRSRRAIPGTIYAGTSEIQRSIIAESALKLPRTR